MKWVAAALVAFAGCAAAVGILAVWLVCSGPREYTGWVLIAAFALAAFGVLMAGLITDAPMGED